MKSSTATRLLAGAAVLLLPALVSAQDLTSIQPAPEYSRGFNVAVRERPHPEWAPIGVHAGSFLLQPEVYGGVTLTDNEQDLSSGGKSDVIFSVDPRLNFSSDWSRHGLAGGVWYRRNQNTRVTSDSSNEYGLNTRGKLDISGDLILVGRVEVSHFADPSSDPDAPVNRSRRAMYDRDLGQVTLTKNLPRLQLQGVLNYLNMDYDSVPLVGGGVADLSARNSRYENAVGKVTYSISPELGFFVGALADKTTRPRVGAFNQNSSGFTLGGGADFDLSRLARGEVQIGYYRESYDQTGLSSDAGLNVQADIQYFPTQLTTMNFSLSRTALTNARNTAAALTQNNNVAGAPGGSALSGGVTVDHELLRNLILSGSVAASKSDYTGIDRRDRSLAATAGATYLMNRHIGLDLSYQHLSFDSSGLNARRSYDENRLWLNMRFSY